MTNNTTIRIAGSITLFSLLLLAPMPAFAGSAKISGTPVADAITTDGVATDWQGLSSVYLENSVRNLAVAHDADHLFLSFSFGDESLAQKILRQGVTVWINGDNKKKESFGVRYMGSTTLAEALENSRPAANAPEIDPGRSGRGRRGMHPEMATPGKPGTLTLLWDDGQSSEVLAENEDGGANAASALNDGVFVYEFTIPIALIGDELAEAPADKQRTLRLGLQIGGLAKYERQALRDSTEGSRGGRSGGFGGQGGGMGGGRGGGMGGRGGRGGSPQRLDRPQVEWLKVVLEP